MGMGETDNIGLASLTSPIIAVQQCFVGRDLNVLFKGDYFSANVAENIFLIDVENEILYGQSEVNVL